MNAGPAGFHNAPVTKVVSFTCCVASIIIGMQGGVASCSLSYQAIVQKLHLWRLITSGFVFSSTPELMCGVYLLYYFRVLERQIGSNKHLVFVLFSMIFTTMCELISLVMFKDPISSGLAPGPYGLIFSSFVLFFYDIPVSKRFRIFNIQLSDKSFVYFAGLQLLLSSWKLSFIPGVCGVLAGFSYRLNVFCIRRIKFPEVVASAVARIFSPLLSRGQSNSGSRRNITTEIVNPTLGRQFQGGFPASALPLGPPVAPTEEAISTLVSMGFDRNLSTRALEQARYDITVATNLLLEAQSH